MLKKLAYLIVYHDLMKCSICRGVYDAKHGQDSFMHGVSLVMEAIAYHISDDTGDSFSDMFLDNMQMSKEKYND